MKISRLFDSIYYQAENHPQSVALACKINGNWKHYSTEDTINETNQLSLGLLSLDVSKGDKVGIVSGNRPEWVFADLAVSQIGGINVPMYPNSTPDDYAFILNDAEVKVVFAGDKEIYDKIKKACADLDCVKAVFTFDEIPGARHWTEVKALGKEEDMPKVTALKDEVKAEAMATLIYTSGTTGTPKGVMLSHNNILSNAIAVGNAFPTIGSDFKVLSFLPLCHIFERTAMYLHLYKGISVYYAESMDAIADNLKEVQPDFFATVPRLLEKVYDRILTRGYELKGLKRAIFFWAVNLAQQYKVSENQGWWYNFKLGIANKIVFSKWREALGNNVKFIVSGAAALQPRLATIFWAARIKVLEAYGMTESSPGVTFTRSEAENVRIGCVGSTLEKVEVKIADDGEILVKGPNVMMGYYKRPDLTASTISEDGWLHTGDIGELVENKFLKITDRKKEIFKTSGGKYIAPQAIENKFKESMFIEQIMVVGESQKFPAALIVPSFENLKKWAELHNVSYTDDKALMEMAEVHKKFESEVAKYNDSFAQFEKVKKFKILSEPWNVDSGELTPTLKLKRKIILEKYKEHVDAFYA